MLRLLLALTILLTTACGTKMTCDASTCATGCCDADGQCRPGKDANACGTAARACSACQATQACVMGACSGSGSGGSGGGAATGGSAGGGIATNSDVVINELATSDGDFVELFNRGTQPVSLAGYQVADLDTATMGPKLSSAVTFPAGTTLASGAHLLLVEGTTSGPTTSCADAGIASCFAFTFGLSNTNGDAVFLLAPDAGLVDQATYAAGGHTSGNSWGRLPNGTGAFQQTRRTPGVVNEPVSGTGGAGGGSSGTGGGTGGGATGGSGGGATGGSGGSGGGATGGGVGGGAATLDVVPFAVVLVGPAADGGALSNASAQVAVQARDTNGTVNWTTSLPTVASGANRAFTLSGSATSEGLLNLSANGFFTLAGYAAAPGIPSVNGAAVNAARVVARVGVDGGVDTSTAITDAYAANNIRAATTVDGTGYWLAGTATLDGGVRYVVHGSSGATTSVYVEQQNIRSVQLFDGQLYASTQAGTAVSPTYSRVFAVGTGTPMSTSSIRALLGVDVSTPNGFWLLDVSTTEPGLDTLYVADTTNGAGVRKYSATNGTWAATAQFFVPSTTACYSVTAKRTANGVAVLCSAVSNVYRWDDVGAADGGMPSVVGSVDAGFAFRGLTVLP